MRGHARHSQLWKLKWTDLRGAGCAHMPEVADQWHGRPEGHRSRFPIAELSARRQTLGVLPWRRHGLHCPTEPLR